jgi:hypothetical protein
MLEARLSLHISASNRPISRMPLAICVDEEVGDVVATGKKPRIRFAANGRAQGRVADPLGSAGECARMGPGFRNSTLASNWTSAIACIERKPARSMRSAIGSMCSVRMRVAHRHCWPSRSVSSVRREACGRLPVARGFRGDEFSSDGQAWRSAFRALEVGSRRRALHAESA